MKATELGIRLREAMFATDRPDEAVNSFDQFLPEADFHVRPDVETARIIDSARGFRIEFGEAFLEKELARPRDLAFVFLHEVYHHVLGHLSAIPPEYRVHQWAFVANLAADMMVNRVVTHRYFQHGVPLLDRLYQRDGFPACLLLPPESYGLARAILDQNDDRRRLFRRELDRAIKSGLSKAGMKDPAILKEVCRVYRAGWLDDVPFDRLFGMVANLLDRTADGQSPLPVFLGSHDPDTTPVDGLSWPADNTAAAAGYSEEESDDELDDGIEPALSPELARAVRMALVHDPNHRARGFGTVPRTGILFSPARSDWLALAMGHWPVLFHGPAFSQVDNSRGARIYVDVSGSVSGLISGIYGLVLALANEISLPVHLFSNRVMDLTMDELARGRVRTTGGTDFDCVVTHALDRGYRRIVVITDGMGDVSADNAEAFRASGTSLYLLLTGMGSGPGRFLSPLVPLARQVWDMEV